MSLARCEGFEAADFIIPDTGLVLAGVAGDVLNELVRMARIYPNCCGIDGLEMVV